MSEQTQRQQVLLLLDIFDSFWSEFPIFSTKPPPTPSVYPPPETTLDVKVELAPGTARTALHARSMSDTYVAMAPSLQVSPDHVLSVKPRLGTVVSGKEAADFFGDGGLSPVKTGEEIGRPGRGERVTRRRSREKRVGIARTGSRSLSELEFDELKGFMDLGFVFSEQDRDSATLVSIIPGLQRRLGTEGEAMTAVGVSRPYLSEAWGAFKQERKALPASWRIPQIRNNDGTGMKDQLKFWAQAVASAVR